MPNRIEEFRTAKGLSMAKLGELAGTSAQQINKLEKGQVRLTVDWMMRLAPHLGVEPKDLMSQVEPDLSGRPADTALTGVSFSAIYRGAPAAGSDLTLPILGRARGNKAGVFQMPVEQRPVGWTFRPKQLEGALDAYGVFVYDDSMHPMYKHGQTAWVDPRQPTRAGDGVVVVKINDEAIIKEFVSRDDRVLRLRQLRPEETFEIPVSEIRHIHRVVGSIDPLI